MCRKLFIFKNIWQVKAYNYNLRQICFEYVSKFFFRTYRGKTQNVKNYICSAFIANYELVHHPCGQNIQLHIQEIKVLINGESKAALLLNKILHVY